jgi:hypothetical protein
VDTPTPPPPQITKADAARQLWRIGNLTWKLDRGPDGKTIPGGPQKRLHAEIVAKRAADRLVVLCSRGWGKTFTGLLQCFETCLKTPNMQVAFVTKTMRQARANIRQSAETILADCPKALRPTYLKNDHEYVFKNGSVLSLLGVDSERFDTLKGRALNGCFIDECQDIMELDTIVRVVLDPCVLRVSGWMVLAGTVPQDGTHDFVTFVREAQATGHLLQKTIYESNLYTPEQLEQWKARAGGESSNVWRREYLCEMAFSETRQVVPEWTVAQATALTREEPRPTHCDRYVGLDFGFSRDLTIALFGHWDFKNARVVIEDELAVKGCTSAALARDISAKELAIWGPSEEYPEPFRFADGNEPRTIYEMRKDHDLRFSPTDKHGKKVHLNLLRTMVADGRLVVHPSCKTLIKTLFSATWNRQFKSYERDAEIGHADALDALLYLVRNVRQDRNPAPPGQTWLERDGFVRPAQPMSAAAKSFAEAVAAKPRKGGRRLFGF